MSADSRRPLTRLLHFDTQCWEEKDEVGEIGLRCVAGDGDGSAARVLAQSWAWACRVLYLVLRCVCCVMMIQPGPGCLRRRFKCL